MTKRGPPIISRTTQIPKPSRQTQIEIAHFHTRTCKFVCPSFSCKPFGALSRRAPKPRNGLESPKNSPEMVWESCQTPTSQKNRNGQRPRPVQKWCSKTSPKQVESTHTISGRAPKLAQKWSGEPKAPKLVLDKSKPTTFGQHFWSKLSVKTQAPKP